MGGDVGGRWLTGLWGGRGRLPGFLLKGEAVHSGGGCESKGVRRGAGVGGSPIEWGKHDYKNNMTPSMYSTSSMRWLFSCTCLAKCLHRQYVT